MSTSILATKLYFPPPRAKIVFRPCLIERLNERERVSSGRKLTLISAPAGFGKTTLVSEWIAVCGMPAAWLSLDEGDNDPIRFLTYFVAALQTFAANTGAGVVAALHAAQSQPPSIESILTTLINEIATVPEDFVLVLDDYHVIDAQEVHNALTFLLEHLPPQMHLVIATREDPHLPLSRLRARGQLTELRAADLRFTPAEAADFLNDVMGLNLSAEDIAALETRTEGWIAGLQLAALALLAMQGHASRDTASFIKSFTGSHHFVLDYLVEEVLGQQSESVQTFLLRTSILDRMCGPLCDAVLLDGAQCMPGQETLEYLEHANLFVVPLDNERRWYRYHHLFAELLRQRLQQSDNVAEYHIRASQWYENNDLMLEAFRHAAAANEVERAVRLMESKRMPLHIPGTGTVILNWLESLPVTVLNTQPALWWKQAQLLLLSGQTIKVEEKLQATETALAAATQPGTKIDDQTRDLIGEIAAVRSNVALAQQQTEIMLVQARRALEYLHPGNLSSRSSATRDIGFAYYLQGNRMAASRMFAEALSIAQASGDMVEPLLATIGLAEIQELENQLCQAAESYKSILPRIREYSLLNAGVVYLGLARIYYEWNELNTAEQYGEQSLQFAQQYSQLIHRFIICGVFLARLKLARGDATGAATLLAEVEQSARRHNFVHLMPEVATIQVLLLLHQGDVNAAAELAQHYELPMSRARTLLAQGFSSAALEILVLYVQQMEAKGWQHERLRGMVLQVLALNAHGKKDKAVQLLGEALALAEPGGFIRLFVDEGVAMAQLLCEAAARGMNRGYINKLLAAFEAEKRKDEDKSYRPSTAPSQPLIEPLSPRELDILQLIARGLSNRQISERLFLALSTVKGHNRKLFDKLQVQSRTEAVARARELGLL